MKSYVELEIDLPGERETESYVLHREWNVRNKHIEERYEVSRDGQTLDSGDLDFFQNYLYTVVPPNLFDFFFFDGEEIGEFFAAEGYSKYIKNAVITLSGYDTFSLIERFCASFIATEEDNAAFFDAAEAAEQTVETVAALETQAATLERQISEWVMELDGLESSKAAAEERFLRAGGLSGSRREALEMERARQEGIRNDRGRAIRGFVEELMPLYITGNLLENAYRQVEAERRAGEYGSIASLLSPEFLDGIIRQIPGKEEGDYALASSLSAGIAAQIQTETGLGATSILHGLSREQEEQLFTAVSRVRAFSAAEMVGICGEREAAMKKYEAASAELRNALPELDAAAFFEEHRRITQQIGERRSLLEAAQAELEKTREELKAERKLSEKRKDALQALARDQKAYEYTDKIGRIMERMIRNVTSEKFRQVEKLTLEMFGTIIRKDNFVQLFELDDDFNINLYKKQTYTLRELGLLVKNSGAEALEKRLGATGVALAADALGVDSARSLKAFFASNDWQNQLSIIDDRKIETYNRIELSQLSKGEKQVFILSLYWAIIKSSNQDVPFVIDTPFARIDTEHREQIARNFFPEISRQVVILSTDEEVVGAYHDALTPRIAREFVLEYLPESGRTIVRRGYF